MADRTDVFNGADFQLKQELLKLYVELYRPKSEGPPAKGLQQHYYSVRTVRPINIPETSQNSELNTCDKTSRKFCGQVAGLGLIFDGETSLSQCLGYCRTLRTNEPPALEGSIIGIRIDASFRFDGQSNYA